MEQSSIGMRGRMYRSSGTSIPVNGVTPRVHPVNAPSANLQPTAAREITPTFNPAPDFEPQSVVQDTPAEKKSSGGKILGIIFTIFAIIIAFGGGLLFGLNWDKIFPKAEPAPAPVAETHTLTDAEIADLSNKVAYLVMSDAGQDFITMSGYRFLPSLVNNSLTDADKLEIAVYSLRSEYDGGVVCLGTDCPAPDLWISSARVATRYKEIFGTDLVYAESAYCPGYSLSEDKTQYIIGKSDCQLGSDNVDFLFKDSYHYEGGYAFVDIAVGSKFVPSEPENVSNSVIYDNYYTSTDKFIHKTFADLGSVEAFNDFAISKENSNNFMLYSLRFKADDKGNFVFIDTASSAKPAARNNATPSEPTPEVPVEQPVEAPAEASVEPVDDIDHSRDDISYETDPDAPACPHNNPYAICR